MTITIHLFGPIADAAGKRQLELSVDEPQTAGILLKRLIVEQVPALAPLLPSCRLAVNHAYADADAMIGGSDHVALIGLVSGG